MSKARCIARWSVIPLSLLLLAGLALAGCGGGDDSIKGILQKCVDAQKDVKSYHSELRWDYENSQFGTGTREAWIIDISGPDYHINDLQFGMISKIEVIYTGGQMYVKTIENGQWQQTSGATGQALTENQEAIKLMDWMENSTKQTNLGEENVSGYQCYHLQFELSPENVKSMATQVSGEELASCTGGTADFWISTDKYYLVQSEMLVKNATDKIIGKTDIKLLNTYSQINEPITIAPPI